jgi:hypothetical protein
MDSSAQIWYSSGVPIVSGDFMIIQLKRFPQQKIKQGGHLWKEMN